MPKQLRTKNVDKSFCITRRELIAWLTQNPVFDDNTPILLKCGGRNYRFAEFMTVAGKPVLIGKRGAKD